MRRREEGGRQINCPGSEGKDSPAAFGFVASGQEEGGNRTSVTWQKAVLLGCAVRTWRAVVPWQDISQKEKKLTKHVFPV